VVQGRRHERFIRRRIAAISMISSSVSSLPGVVLSTGDAVFSDHPTACAKSLIQVGSPRQLRSVI
jgi:hypothetical protein